MGIDILSAEAKRFGLDQRTGIEVPFETKRLVIPTKPWKKKAGLGGWVPGDTANTAIGQGFLLQTPLQMAAMIASIARNETRTKTTIRALTYGQALQVDHGGESIGLTKSQKAILWEGMERVVGPQGTGRLVQIDGFRIAGKTGTADFRAHGKEVNLAWFIGFAPIENPQIAVAVMVEGTEESQTYHGGSTAGPVAKDIFLKFIEKYPGIELRLITSVSVSDLDRQEADLALRFGNSPSDHLVGRRLTETGRAIYASHEYAERFLSDPSFSDFGSSDFGWISFSPPGDKEVWKKSTPYPNLPTHLRCADMRTQQIACRAGIGLVMLPCFLCDPDPELSRITEPEFVSRQDLWLLRQSEMRKTARVRALSDHIVASIAHLKPLLHGETKETFELAQ